MHIWILTSEMPAQYTGGIGRYIENYTPLLGREGHQVTVITRAEKPHDTEIAPGVRLIGVVPREANIQLSSTEDEPDRHPAYPFNVMSYWPALSFQFAEEVIALLDKLPAPDLIECQEYAGLPYYLLQRKLTERGRLSQIPILVHLHSAYFQIQRINQEPRYRFPEYWIGQMEKFCLRAADAIVSPSHFLAREVQAEVDRMPPIEVIPYPARLDTTSELERSRPGHVLYMGRLEVRKGCLRLVEACARLWERGKDFTLCMIGGDTDFAPLDTTVGLYLRRKYQRWIDAGRLQLPGALPHAELMREVARAWLVTVPSLWENFPNTCIEAMARGRVVLASTRGGQAEMVGESGDAGFVFDWNVADDFERQLTRALALTLEEHRAIGTRARQRISHLCDPDTVLRRRIDHIHRVIAEHQPKRHFPVQTLGQNSYQAEPTAPHEKAGLLSVIIPHYNLGAYLLDAIESARKSTYSELEIVVVDDGSTDPESLAVVSRLEQSSDPAVRVIRQSNQGLASARNTGADHAQGEFITFLDADDEVEPEFYHCAIDVLTRYDNVAFVYSWVRYFDSARGIWPTWNSEFPYLLGHNMLTAFSVVRRSAFQKYGRNKPDIQYSLEDWEGWVSMLEAGAGGVSLARPLVRYRIRAGSMYRSRNVSQLLYLYDLVSEHHRPALNRWGVELFNLQNANGPALAWNIPALPAPTASDAQLQLLEAERERLWKEAQTLSRAWDEHVKYIDAQHAYIASLEAQVQSLRSASLGLKAHDKSGDWDAYVGSRLVKRLRSLPGLPKLLRLSWVKRIYRRVVGV